MADWVVVVDDDVSNLKMAGHILSQSNMRVSALKSGQALLDFVRDNGSPDLILLDIKMPGMDGFETLEKLREQEKGKEEVPIIFLTADESEDSETKGISLGAMDFIKKPFVPDVLVTRVRHMIELIRLRRIIQTLVDAMKSHGDSRDVPLAESVREELEKGRGTQHDPGIVDIILAMIDQG